MKARDDEPMFPMPPAVPPDPRGSSREEQPVDWHSSESSPVILQPKVREQPEGQLFDYSAFWGQPHGPDTEIGAQIAAWVKEHGTPATYEADGSPFRGMVCCVTLDPVTYDEWIEFKQRFRPEMETPIPYL